MLQRNLTMKNRRNSTFIQEITTNNVINVFI